MCSGSGYMILGYAWMDLLSQNKRHKTVLNIHGKASPMKRNYLHAFFVSTEMMEGKTEKQFLLSSGTLFPFYCLLLMKHFKNSLFINTTYAVKSLC